MTSLALVVAMLTPLVTRDLINDLFCFFFFSACGKDNFPGNTHVYLNTAKTNRENLKDASVVINGIYDFKKINLIQLFGEADL